MKYAELNPGFQALVFEQDFQQWQTNIAKSIEKDSKERTFQQLKNEYRQTKQMLEDDTDAFNLLIEKINQNQSDSEFLDSDEENEITDLAVKIVQNLIVADELNKVLLRLKLELAEKERLNEKQQNKKQLQEERTKKLKQEFIQEVTRKPYSFINSQTENEYNKIAAIRLHQEAQALREKFEQAYLFSKSNIKPDINCNLLDADFKKFFPSNYVSLQLTSLERQKAINQLSKQNSKDINDEINNLENILNNPTVLKKYVNSCNDAKRRNPIALLVESLYLCKFVKWMMENQELTKKTTSDSVANVSVANKTNHLCFNNSSAATQKTTNDARSLALFESAINLFGAIELEMRFNPSSKTIDKMVQDFEEIMDKTIALGLKVAETYKEFAFETINKAKTNSHQQIQM